RRHHAEHHMRRAVQVELLAEDGWIGAVARAPEPIADHDRSFLAYEERTADGKAFTQLRPDAEHVEKIAAHFDRVDAHWIQPGIDQVDAWSPPRGSAL